MEHLARLLGGITLAPYIVKAMALIGVRRRADSDLDAGGPRRPFIFRHARRHGRGVASRPQDVMEIEPGVTVEGKEGVRLGQRTALRDRDCEHHQHGTSATEPL
jgi:hypothetical protein